MSKPSRRSSAFDNIDFPLVPDAVFQHAGAAARRALDEIPVLHAVDAIMLVGNALSHGKFYRLHPVGTNLNTKFLAMLDVTGIAITALGGQFLAVTAGFSRHNLNLVGGCDFEELWSDVVATYSAWLGSIYHPALYREQRGWLLSYREREIIAQMRIIRAKSLIRPTEDPGHMEAVRAILADLAEPNRQSGERRRLPDDAVLVEWYRTLRKLPEWDLEDLMLVKSDHTVAFDTRLPTKQGRAKGSGLRGLAAHLSDTKTPEREKSFAEVVEEQALPGQDPAAVAEIRQLLRDLRDLRDATDLPLIEHFLDAIEAHEQMPAALQTARFIHEVTVRAVALQDRALQAAILYEMGAAEWTREQVATAYQLTAEQVRHRERDARDFVATCKSAAAA